MPLMVEGAVVPKSRYTKSVSAPVGAVVIETAKLFCPTVPVLVNELAITVTWNVDVQLGDVEQAVLIGRLNSNSSTYSLTATVVSDAMVLDDPLAT